MNSLFTDFTDIEGQDSSQFIDRFLQQVSRFPQQTAVISAEGKISYAELADRAGALANYLLTLGIGIETPVATLLRSGIEQIICQVAILLAGGSCVPLNVTSPDDRLNFMLSEVRATYTLTDNVGALRSLSTRYITLGSYPLSTFSRTDFPGRFTGEHHRAYIMFTSGTTGKPKAVEVETRGILRLVVNADYLPFSSEDRLGSISAPDFDAILLEVWGALLNGAATVIIDRDVLLDPDELKSSFLRSGVSSILVTPSLFNFITNLCPDAFSSLSYLMIGGEAFNLQALRSLPLSAWPQNIYNVYGPTENTTYTLYYPIGVDDLQADSMPLGKPINQTSVYILDEQQEQVAPGVQGEIYVGGEGVARGYMNRPELTAEKFITCRISMGAEPIRLYKTGDLGWQREDGAFMYAGRADNQIKLQGYRIEAEEVEIQLLNSGLLQEAIVCAVKKEGDEGYLIAFVVPQAGPNFNSRKLLALLQQRLPPYMLPRIQIVDAIPLNPNGKADRAKLLQMYGQPQMLNTVNVTGQHL
ncbi:amino acid adenylation domain-containing protein [Pantoea coffeiphila]|uniref:Thioester reductase n=1 Tax=Pantoea coffeiphila TaxID=1465635 RepID=A0A2S9I9K6_9GAMM|nr:amino acid adenylation domain-containing protein [Pantoea coffeiphila]PRD14451.1 hypothetical protein CQW29_16500 [Pantoea coffeiphila]